MAIVRPLMLARLHVRRKPPPTRDAYAPAYQKHRAANKARVRAVEAAPRRLKPRIPPNGTMSRLRGLSPASAERLRGLAGPARRGFNRPHPPPTPPPPPKHPPPAGAF